MKLITLFLPALVALASVGSAQQGPPPRELMLTKRIFLALNPNVKSEIKLTGDEREKIMNAFNGALEIEGERIRLSLSGGQDLGEMVAEGMKVLDAGQRRRLEELWIQRLKGLAIADDEIAKKVGLTAEQKREADRLVEEGGNAIAEIMMGNPSPNKGKKVDAIRSDYGKRVLNLLTEGQKKTYEGLKGKPFEPKTL